jgi:protocatechuate 3,4-dioxygenase beta subunit
MLAVLLGSVPVLRAEDPVDEAEDLHTVVVRVTDENGKPLENARVHVSVWPLKGNVRPKVPTDYQTDAEGKAAVKIPPVLRILRLWASKAGHVPRFVNFDDLKDEDTGAEIPDRFTFQLEKGAEIGGTMVDEAGQPIAGVKVEVRVDVDEPEWGPGPKSIISTWLTDEDYGPGPPVTDANGQWRLDNAPAPKKPGDYQFQLLVTHKDYVSDLDWGGLQDEAALTTASLRDGTANLTLKRGVLVQGTVVNESGQPVTEGLVIWHKEPYAKKTVLEAALDKAGRFQTLRLSPGEYPFTIVAPGYSPQRQMVTVTQSMDDLKFTLKPGKRLAIRFVDTAGVPVPKVSVGIASWREEQALHNHNHPYYVPDSKIPRQADENGLYVWDWAPEDEVGYYFYAEGFKDASDTLTAAKDDHIITLEPEPE